MRGLKRSCHRQNKKIIAIIVSAILLICSFIISLLFGAVKISISDIWNILIGAEESGVASRIFFYSRLPRTVACVISGAALAVSGCIVQGVLSNKLASPSIIGINSGAGLAVTLCCATGLIMNWMIAIASFVGALIAVIIVVALSSKMNASRSMVILSGVAVNSFFGAISQSISVLDTDVAILSNDFNIGGFSSVTYDGILYAGILTLVALAITLTLTNELDVISLGEDTAQGLGMSVKRMRKVFIVLAAMLAGASVSIAGLLGFVGLLVPHIVRRFVGNESRYLIPASVLVGASFVLLCDVIARCVFSPHEIQVGIIMAFIGGPFFIYLLFKKRTEKIS